MASRGKKDCPNCKAETAARSHLCRSCGWHFATKEVRKDLLEKKVDPIKNKIYTSLGQGKKGCPECQTIVGAVTKICPKCNFDYVSARKEIVEAKIIKDEEKNQKKEEEKVEKTISAAAQEFIKAPPYVAPKQLSSVDHAKRILSYGPVQAKVLLSLSQNNKNWNHVDWKTVEEGLLVKT